MQKHQAELSWLGVTCRCSGQECGDVLQDLLRSLSHRYRLAGSEGLTSLKDLSAQYFEYLSCFVHLSVLLFLSSVACRRKVSRHLCQDLAEISFSE